MPTTDHYLPIESTCMKKYSLAYINSIHEFTGTQTNSASQRKRIRTSQKHPKPYLQISACIHRP